MKRLCALDRFLLLTLVPLWAVCFSLYVRSLVLGQLARVPIYPTAAIDGDYPVVNGFRPGEEGKHPELGKGDKILKIGRADAKSLGTMEVWVRVYAQAGGELHVPLTVQRAVSIQEAQLHLIPVALPWKAIPISLSFVIAAVLILLRAPTGSRVARAIFIACLAYSVQWTFFFGDSLLLTYIWTVVFFCSSLVVFPMTLQAVLVFPEEFSPQGKRLSFWHWLFSGFALTTVSAWFGVPLPPEFAFLLYFIVTAVFIATLLMLLGRCFYLVGPDGRRQIKWIVWGLYLGTVPTLVADTITSFTPVLWGWHDWSVLSMIFIPVSLIIASSRFRFLDIDRLLSGAIVSSLLFIFLVGTMLLIEPQFQAGQIQSVQIEASEAIRGGVSQISLFLPLVLIATAMFPFLRRRVEGVWLPERRAFEKQSRHLLQQMSEQNTLRSLLEFIGDGLCTSLRPETCVVFVKEEVTYMPVFASGGAPLYPLPAPLMRVLLMQAGIPDRARWRRQVREALKPEERMLLLRLRTVGVFPFGRNESPLAVLCLGKKSSGDIYTVFERKCLRDIGLYIERRFGDEQNQPSQEQQSRDGGPSFPTAA